ncbi:MAG: phosphoribosyl transferase [Chloroflexi bacterium]|nr:phosphoribosyl transferase [Chloroflexota bacterium]
MYSTRQKAIFESRRDAGRQLAARLSQYDGKPVVVLAIPNGGVPVGLEVAGALKADFDVIVCRKIPMPLSPEAGFGAIADDGTIVLNPEATRKIGITEAQIEFEANKVRAEVKKRSLLYKGNRPLVSLTNKTVIIVDDGLASGITMQAAVESVRRRHPKEIIVAVPAASAVAIQQLEKAADKVVTCAIGTMSRFYVADFYRNWRDLADNEILQFLRSERPEWGGKP